MIKTFISTLALVAAGPALAQALPDEEPADRQQSDNAIIVTGTRSLSGTTVGLSGSSVTVIDSEAMQQRQIRIVSDVLRDVPGVSVNRSGGVGGQTQVRLRGAESNQTLVLIDGIEVSDPFQGEFDFATLIADDVARIEVLRGQQSAIYGSDAIGGVIHYITATGAEAPGVSGRVESGSFGTVSGAARIGGVAGAVDYVLSAAINHSDGTPSARRGIGTRTLAADNHALSGKLTVTLAPNFLIRVVGRYSRLESDINPQDFDFTSPTYGFVIDGDDDSASRAFYGLVRAELDLLDGHWTHAATTQINDNIREFRTAGDLTSANDGQRLKGSYDTTLRFGTARVEHAVTLAADFERETFRNRAVFGAPSDANIERRIDNTGLVAQYDLVVDDRFAFGASLRHDDNDRFRNATTYRLRGSAEIAPGFRLRAAAGSGIKNPTNFELFGFDPSSFIGNPNLRPEKSEGWEAGADIVLADETVRIGATYFDSTLENEIFTNFSPTFVASPANRTTDSKQHGVELFANAALGRGWRVDLAYTYLDAEENGLEELRRPPHTGSANVSWRSADDRFGATATARYNGETFDSNFTSLPIGPRVELDDFVLVNLAADYRLSERFELFGRVENLFDEKYEEVFTFRSPGRAAYAGVRARF